MNSRYKLLLLFTSFIQLSISSDGKLKVPYAIKSSSSEWYIPAEERDNLPHTYVYNTAGLRTDRKYIFVTDISPLFNADVLDYLHGPLSVSILHELTMEKASRAIYKSINT